MVIFYMIADESASWDMVSVKDLWEDKHSSVDESDQDGYVLVKQEDIVEGIACFMAAYLLSLEQAKVYCLFNLCTSFLSVCLLVSSSVLWNCLAMCS